MMRDLTVNNTLSTMFNYIDDTLLWDSLHRQLQANNTRICSGNLIIHLTIHVCLGKGKLSTNLVAIRDSRGLYMKKVSKPKRHSAVGDVPLRGAESTVSPGDMSCYA